MLHLAIRVFGSKVYKISRREDFSKLDFSNFSLAEISAESEDGYFNTNEVIRSHRTLLVKLLTKEQLTFDCGSLPRNCCCTLLYWRKLGY